MDTGTDKNNPKWLNPDALIELIDELRESGYKIGISQYIAAQDLILMLIAQGEILDTPEKLRNLLGPIVCTSAIEQEDFQQRFNCWLNLYNYTPVAVGDVDAKAQELSSELAKERSLFYEVQNLTFFIGIFIFLCTLLFPLLFQSANQKQLYIQPTATTQPIPIPTQTEPLPTPTGILPAVPPKQLQAEPSPSPETSNSPFDLQVLLLSLGIFISLFLSWWSLWRLWWFWRANLFLERHSTNEKPELQKISLAGLEANLIPNILLLKIAQGLRYRVPISSRELDVNQTIDRTFRQGGWLTPVYRNYQIIPEYLFLVNRTSYRDHQAKFIEEIIERLQAEGVFITIYFFDDDPRICFPNSGESSPLMLREIISKYNDHRLVIISEAGTFFSSVTGELSSWVNQFTNWDNRSFLTPTPAESWGYQELELAQEFIILPATLKGLEVLSQRLRWGSATYYLTQEVPAPLPDTLTLQPYLWIERNSPPTDQVNVMLASLEKYLGKDAFYWLSACAIFPQLHWNITIYLGNVLKSEDGEPLIESCSVTDLARLPWLRYGYIPDWLRVYLISTLTQEQQQTIRAALQNLLITAIQGSSSKFQLEIAQQYPRLLPNLVKPILDLISKKSDANSQLRDYIFLTFMTEKSVLGIKVGDEFSRLLQKQKRYDWLLNLFRKARIINEPPIYQPSFRKNSIPASPLIKRRQFLQCIGWGGVGVMTTVVAHQTTQNINKRNSAQSQNNSFNSDTLNSFNFEIVRVNAQGNITNRSQRQAQYFAEDLDNGVTLEMVAIPGGSFVMGSPAAEAGRSNDESPQHNVRVNPFFMGRYEITQAQYQAIMDNNPANFKGDTRPVERVSWNDAVEFCRKLSQRTGRNYRLPSESEWEYACRAGTTTPFYFGETITADLVNYDATQAYASAPTGQNRQQTTPVGSFPSNAFGLYDMHGNVWEWCQDTWHDNYNGAPTDGSPWINENDNNSTRLLRGGSWYLDPVSCRSALRDSSNPGYYDYFIGFRVVCDGEAARTP